MNAAAAPASGMFTGTTRIAVMVIGLVLLAVVIYYLYKFLKGDETRQDMIVYNMTGNGLLGTKETIFETKNIPTIYGGGEYSVSLWVYVNNWGQSKGNNKRIFTILSGSSTASYATLAVYMGQNVNKLGIRTSYETGTDLNTQQLTMINNGTNPYSDMATDFRKCDIESVDLQRWVNITIVLSGRTTDVYIDGKLSRSCVNDGLFKVADPLTAKFIVGGTDTNSLGGYIGSIRAANFAYTPDTVYQIYQNGPKDTSFLSQLLSWFNPSEYSFSLKRNGTDIVTATTAGGGGVGGSLVDSVTGAAAGGAAPGGAAPGGTAAGGAAPGGTAAGGAAPGGTAAGGAAPGGAMA